MIYWDTSALVSVMIEEPASGRVFSFLGEHGNLESYTSLFTFLEIESALQRRLNDRSLAVEDANIARAAAGRFRKKAKVINADENILDVALHYQKIYALRAGDALQLASARIGAKSPLDVQFMCLDKLLSQAAFQEGFELCLGL